ncbi:MAG: YafY family protein [Pseudomonadota bacterium]
MSRTHRLFQMMQTLRSLPPPVTAAALAQEMEMSPRTIYRDIDALRSMGAVIDGEAGFGYTLVEDATLPPLAFEDDELEALVLGLRDVAAIGDPALAKAAKTALSKIKARVPPRQAHRLQHAVLSAHRLGCAAAPIQIDVATLRAAAWEEMSVRFHYTDAKADETDRTVDPLGLVYLDQTNVLLAHCHLRRDYRIFRLDRMEQLVVTNMSFRPRRVPMLREHLARIREEISLSAADRA